MRKILIFSGGMDSTVLLHSEIQDGHRVDAVSFNYGQRHSRELEFAASTCDRLAIPHSVIDLSHLGRFLDGGSALLAPGAEVPEGHYAGDNMKATVVPNRNMIMLSIAAGVAIARGAEVVTYAAHPGDHAIYPDCRPEFAEALDLAIGLCDWSKIKLERPFIERGIDKAGIARLGHRLMVDWSGTWSCYNGREKHCGNCGTCVERREAFELAGIDDPTEYEAGAKPLGDLLKGVGV